MPFRIKVVTSKTKTGIVSSPDFLSCLLPALAVAVILAFTASAFSQQAILPPPQTTVKLSSAKFIASDGMSVEGLIELGTSRRADLLAARQRLAIAEGRLLQAGLRPNPILDTEYGSARFLGGEPENDFSAGVSQTFELGGKRSKRVAVAQLELSQTRAEVATLERAVAIEIRSPIPTH